MTAFTSVKCDSLSELIDKARMKAIECYVLGEQDGWVSLQFTSDHGRTAFESIARSHGAMIHSDLSAVSLSDALTAVTEGCDRELILTALIEANNVITRGMSNAYSRSGNYKFICSNEQCGATIPSYRGRYPESCPNCSSPLRRQRS